MELTGSSLSQYIMFSGDKLNIGGYQMKWAGNYPVSNMS